MGNLGFTNNGEALKKGEVKAVIALLTLQIKASAVDWPLMSIQGTEEQKEIEKHKSMQKLKDWDGLKLYPPRMEVKVSGISKKDNLMMELVFSGANEELRLLEHLRIDPCAHILNPYNMMPSPESDSSQGI